MEFGFASTKTVRMMSISFAQDAGGRMRDFVRRLRRRIRKS